MLRSPLRVIEYINEYILSLYDNLEQYEKVVNLLILVAVDYKYGIIIQSMIKTFVKRDKGELVAV